MLAVLLFSGPSLLSETDRTHHDATAPLRYDSTRLALHYLPVKAGKSVAVVDTHLIRANSNVDGGIEIADWVSGDVLARIPFGRVKWTATIPGSPWIVAWSSIWSELALFKVDTLSRLEKVAVAWEGDEDAVGICAGTSVIGDRIVALLQKGGVAQIYRVVSQLDSVVLQKMRAVTVLTHLNEVMTSCVIDGTAPYRVIVATTAGNLLSINIANVNDQRALIATDSRPDFDTFPLSWPITVMTVFYSGNGTSPNLLTYSSHPDHLSGVFSVISPTLPGSKSDGTKRPWRPSCRDIGVQPAVTLRPSMLVSHGVAVDNDDAEIYVHPRDPAASVVLGTTKSRGGDGGLHVWTMDGREVWFAPMPKGSGLNSVSRNAIAAWRIDPDAVLHNAKLDVDHLTSMRELKRILVPVGNHLVDLDPDDIAVYGSCTLSYQPRGTPPVARRHYLFMATKSGIVHQFRVGLDSPVAADLEPSVRLTRVRHWTVGFGTQLENCVGDPDSGSLYIGEEAVGVWHYPLGLLSEEESVPVVAVPDPNPVSRRYHFPLGRRPGQAPMAPILLDSTPLVNPRGQLHRDVEGLGLYRDPRGQGRHVLVVSSQGSNSYNLYELGAADPPPLVASLAIVSGAKGDAVTKTDSLAVTSAVVGPGFKHGVLVVHDDATTDPWDLTRVEPNASFKVVAWSEILAGMSATRA
ncbi:hypothetical protein GGF31_004681 [Allomyces arbusculus]|nr:hypothetical protein GGF31_004681 [Allomyces arbusculus]